MKELLRYLTAMCLPAACQRVLRMLAEIVIQVCFVAPDKAEHTWCTNLHLTLDKAGNLKLNVRRHLTCMMLLWYSRAPARHLF